MDNMTEENQITLYDQITEAARDAIAQALERHRKLGESIAVWQDGKVVVLSADQIPLSQELIDKTDSTSSTKISPRQEK
jgi:archaellum biogenesis ATPase FlaH